MMGKYDILSHNYDKKKSKSFETKLKKSNFCVIIDFSLLIHEFACPSSPDVKLMWLVVLNGGLNLGLGLSAEFNAPLRYYLD